MPADPIPALASAAEGSCPHPKAVTTNNNGRFGLRCLTCGHITTGHATHFSASVAMWPDGVNARHAAALRAREATP